MLLDFVAMHQSTREEPTDQPCYLARSTFYNLRKISKNANIIICIFKMFEQMNPDDGNCNTRICELSILLSVLNFPMQ